MALSRKRNDNQTEPWERQEGESWKAYEAFCVFRDLGGKRTTPATAKQLGKNENLIKRWRSQYNWNDRAQAFDISVQRDAYEQAVKEKASMTARHITTALAIQKKAVEALKSLDIAKMKPRDIREYIQLGTELERLSRQVSLGDLVADLNAKLPKEDTIGYDMPIIINVRPDQEGGDA